MFGINLVLVTQSCCVETTTSSFPQQGFFRKICQQFLNCPVKGGKKLLVPLIALHYFTGPEKGATLFLSLFSFATYRSFMVKYLLQNLSPSSVSCVADLGTGGGWFDPRLCQNFFRGLVVVIETGFIPLSPLSVVLTMVMWKSSQLLSKNIVRSTG